MLRFRHVKSVAINPCVFSYIKLCLSVCLVDIEAGKLSTLDGGTSHPVPNGNPTTENNLHGMITD